MPEERKQVDYVATFRAEVNRENFAAAEKAYADLYNSVTKRVGNINRTMLNAIEQEKGVLQESFDEMLRSQNLRNERQKGQPGEEQRLANQRINNLKKEEQLKADILKLDTQAAEILEAQSRGVQAMGVAGQRRQSDSGLNARLREIEELTNTLAEMDRLMANVPALQERIINLRKQALLDQQQQNRTQQGAIKNVLIEADITEGLANLERERLEVVKRRQDFERREAAFRRGEQREPQGILGPERSAEIANENTLVTTHLKSFGAEIRALVGDSKTLGTTVAELNVILERVARGERVQAEEIEALITRVSGLGPAATSENTIQVIQRLKDLIRPPTLTGRYSITEGYPLPRGKMGAQDIRFSEAERLEEFNRVSRALAVLEELIKERASRFKTVSLGERGPEAREKAQRASAEAYLRTTGATFDDQADIIAQAIELTNKQLRELGLEITNLGRVSVKADDDMPRLAAERVPGQANPLSFEDSEINRRARLRQQGEAASPADFPSFSGTMEELFTGPATKLTARLRVEVIKQVTKIYESLTPQQLEQLPAKLVRSAAKYNDLIKSERDTFERREAWQRMMDDIFRRMVERKPQFLAKTPSEYFTKRRADASDLDYEALEAAQARAQQVADDSRTWTLAVDKTNEYMRRYAQDIIDYADAAQQEGTPELADQATQDLENVKNGLNEKLERLDQLRRDLDNTTLDPSYVRQLERDTVFALSTKTQRGNAERIADIKDPELRQLLLNSLEGTIESEIVARKEAISREMEDVSNEIFGGKFIDPAIIKRSAEFATTRRRRSFLIRNQNQIREALVSREARVVDLTRQFEAIDEQVRDIADESARFQKTIDKYAGAESKPRQYGEAVKNLEDANKKIEVLKQRRIDLQQQLDEANKRFESAFEEAAELEKALSLGEDPLKQRRGKRTMKLRRARRLGLYTAPTEAQLTAQQEAVATQSAQLQQAADVAKNLIADFPNRQTFRAAEKSQKQIAENTITLTEEEQKLAAARDLAMQKVTGLRAQWESLVEFVNRRLGTGEPLTKDEFSNFSQLFKMLRSHGNAAFSDLVKTQRTFNETYTTRIDAERAAIRAEGDKARAKRKEDEANAAAERKKKRDDAAAARAATAKPAGAGGGKKPPTAKPTAAAEPEGEKDPRLAELEQKILADTQAFKDTKAKIASLKRKVENKTKKYAELVAAGDTDEAAKVKEALDKQQVALDKAIARRDKLWDAITKNNKKLTALAKQIKAEQKAAAEPEVFQEDIQAEIDAIIKRRENRKKKRDKERAAIRKLERVKTPTQEQIDELQAHVRQVESFDKRDAQDRKRLRDLQAKLKKARPRPEGYVAPTATPTTGDDATQQLNQLAEIEKNFAQKAIRDSLNALRRLVDARAKFIEAQSEINQIQKKLAEDSDKLSGLEIKGLEVALQRKIDEREDARTQAHIAGQLLMQSVPKAKLDAPEWDIAAAEIAKTIIPDNQYLTDRINKILAEEAEDFKRNNEVRAAHGQPELTISAQDQAFHEARLAIGERINWLMSASESLYQEQREIETGLTRLGEQSAKVAAMTPEQRTERLDVITQQQAKYEDALARLRILTSDAPRQDEFNALRAAGQQELDALIAAASTSTTTTTTATKATKKSTKAATDLSQAQTTGAVQATTAADATTAAATTATTASQKATGKLEEVAVIRSGEAEAATAAAAATDKASNANKYFSQNIQDFYAEYGSIIRYIAQRSGDSQEYILTLLENSRITRQRVDEWMVELESAAKSSDARRFGRVATNLRRAVQAGIIDPDTAKYLSVELNRVIADAIGGGKIGVAAQNVKADFFNFFNQLREGRSDTDQARKALLYFYRNLKDISELEGIKFPTSGPAIGQAQFNQIVDALQTTGLTNERGISQEKAAAAEDLTRKVVTRFRLTEQQADLLSDTLVKLWSEMVTTGYATGRTQEEIDKAGNALLILAEGLKLSTGHATALEASMSDVNITGIKPLNESLQQMSRLAQETAKGVPTEPGDIKVQPFYSADDRMSLGDVQRAADEQFENETARLIIRARKFQEREWKETRAGRIALQAREAARREAVFGDNADILRYTFTEFQEAFKGPLGKIQLAIIETAKKFTSAGNQVVEGVKGIGGKISGGFGKMFGPGGPGGPGSGYTPPEIQTRPPRFLQFAVFPIASAFQNLQFEVGAKLGFIASDILGIVDNLLILPNTMAKVGEDLMKLGGPLGFFAKNIGAIGKALGLSGVAQGFLTATVFAAPLAAIAALVLVMSEWNRQLEESITKEKERLKVLEEINTKLAGGATPEELEADAEAARQRAQGAATTAEGILARLPENMQDAVRAIGAIPAEDRRLEDILGNMSPSQMMLSTVPVSQRPQSITPQFMQERGITFETPGATPEEFAVITSFVQAMDDFRAAMQDAQNNAEGAITPQADYNQLVSDEIKNRTQVNDLMQQSQNLTEAERVARQREALQRYALLNQQKRDMQQAMQDALTAGDTQQFMVLSDAYDQMVDGMNESIQEASNEAAFYGSQFAMSLARTTDALTRATAQLNTFYSAIQSGFKMSAQDLATQISEMQSELTMVNFSIVDAFRQGATEEVTGPMIERRQALMDELAVLRNIASSPFYKALNVLRGVAEFVKAFADLNTKFLEETRQLATERNQQILDDLEQYGEQRGEYYDSYQEDIADYDKQHLKDREKALKDYNKDIAKAEEEHRERLEEIAKDGMDDYWNAVGERDALGAYLALQEIEKQKKKEEDQFQKEKDDRLEQYMEQLQELEDSLREQKEKRLEQYQEQLDEQDEQFAKQQEKQRRQWDKEDAAREAQFQKDVANLVRESLVQAGIVSDMTTGWTNFLNGLTASFAQFWLNNERRAQQALTAGVGATAGMGAGGATGHVNPAVAAAYQGGVQQTTVTGMPNWLYQGGPYPTGASPVTISPTINITATTRTAIRRQVWNELDAVFTRVVAED